ncbi:hypothetical protein [Ruegeria lacuscaerulensis]|uniref:hypothetical protein n=1 Tax=Ruegeria lacuscaerulensis TaxID=55218 RepID=UPI00147E532C|nr:hypothetical protein [Ruegeria lacuscaerulensis]
MNTPALSLNTPRTPWASVNTPGATGAMEVGEMDNGKDAVQRYSSSRNASGLGFSNGIVLDSEGDFVAYSEYAALSARVAELENDRAELALAIMGGEDAPGFAAAQLTETLVKLIADNRKDAIAWAEYDAKQAEQRGRLQGLRDAADWINEMRISCRSAAVNGLREKADKEALKQGVSE